MTTTTTPAAKSASSFTLGDVPVGTGNPLQTKRAKVINYINDQRKLLAAPNYRPVRVRRGKDKKRVEKATTIHPCWKRVGNSFAVTLRVAGKLVTFDSQGRNAIMVPATGAEAKERVQRAGRLRDGREERGVRRALRVKEGEGLCSRRAHEGRSEGSEQACCLI